MKTILLTGNDTEVGKTWVTGTLAKLLASSGDTVQVVKPIECGVPEGEMGDALNACSRAESDAVSGYTFYSLPEPLAPRSATGGQAITVDAIVAKVDQLPVVDWRIVESAGGVTVPIEGNGSDWADLGKALNVDLVIGVVDDRLGAINQTRLLAAYLKAREFPFAIWLNETKVQEEAVHESNISALNELKIPLCAIQRFQSEDAEILRAIWSEESLQSEKKSTDSVSTWKTTLEQRREQKLERVLRARSADETDLILNLADNDYLRLSQHPEVVAAAREACRVWGTSASASPLITGFTTLHEELETVLKKWHGFDSGLIWNSGYSANQAVLSQLPSRGDLILADRLIHNSMVSGILRSGAQLMRYQHCDLSHLESLLKKYEKSGRQIFVVTESVFSMDGDYPDLAALAELKERYNFFWIVDEAHAIGWYGECGSGLVEHFNCAKQVDVLVGTLGKGLGSMGAYTLFHDETLRQYLINFAGEFIYSTYLAPSAVAAAMKAVELCQSEENERPLWRQRASHFRESLAKSGWSVSQGGSPIVPIILGTTEEAIELSASLLSMGTRVCAIRPPTVPADTSRLRLSLHSSLSDSDYQKIVQQLSDAAGRR